MGSSEESRNGTSKGQHGGVTWASGLTADLQICYNIGEVKKARCVMNIQFCIVLASKQGVWHTTQWVNTANAISARYIAEAIYGDRFIVESVVEARYDLVVVR